MQHIIVTKCSKHINGLLKWKMGEMFLLVFFMHLWATLAWVEVMKKTGWKGIGVELLKSRHMQIFGWKDKNIVEYVTL